MSVVLRHDWDRKELQALFDLPFPELLHRAASVHRAHFDPAQVQVSTLLSVKTGGCPEDCAYCPQAQRYDTGVSAQKLMETEEVVAKARQAKAAGASRFCMGAAWRSPKERDIPKVAAMIREVKAMVDRDDDIRMGSKSTAILFGRFDLIAQGILYALMAATLVMVGLRADLGAAYWAGLGAAALLVAYEFRIARHRERGPCFRAFLHNNWVGLAIFVGIAVAVAGR